MKRYTVYVCEVCGYECRNSEEMSKHEAAHFGLTVEELHEYNAIKSFVRYADDLNSRKDNDNTRNMLDEAMEKLSEFEKKHWLKE